MIDLSLYSKFERDIQSKNTSIYPLLIIGEFSDNQDVYIAISTVKEVIPLFDSVSTPGLIQFQDGFVVNGTFINNKLQVEKYDDVDDENDIPDEDD